jgi:hypothetical protein
MMFTSGPHVSCYRARSALDGTDAGVRCVKYANLTHRPGLRGVAFVWYGEGTDAAGYFRHFGEAFIVPDVGDLIAHAAGLSGNGERDEPFLRLRIGVETGASEVPARLTVTGDRSEEWTLVPDGVLPDFKAVPRRIAKAGPHFREFLVRKEDGTPGTGVRMMLTSGSWLGSGRWGDMTYLHLGTFIGDPVRSGPTVQLGAADIGYETGTCGAVSWGELSVRAVSPTALQVTGAWTERWQLRHPAQDQPVDTRVADCSLFG